MKSQILLYLLSFLSCLYLGSATACKYRRKNYGTQLFPARSCADILAKRCILPKDGIYWIRIPYDATPFPVFCNMKAGGWTMVYKIVAGITGSPAKIWNFPLTSFEYSLAALNTKNHFRHHYKNRMVRFWSHLRRKEARVVLYKGGNEEVALRFRANRGNNKNWFAQANLLESPWQDILHLKKNFFTLVGPCWKHVGCRDFHINHVYGGCPRDDGWLSVGDSSGCPWEKKLPHGVKIIYTKNTHSNYNKHKNVGHADVLAVFLR